MTLSVELDGAGVRVAVADGSHVLPRWSPSSATSLCGRGLPLVARLSQRWGAEPLPGGGKRVWAQVDTASMHTDTGHAEDLVELWTDEPWPVEPPAAAGIDIDLDVDVQAMLDSRAHTEDLVRDLQLTLLSLGAAADAGNASRDEITLVRLARRLDTANEQFHDPPADVRPDRRRRAARAAADHAAPPLAGHRCCLCPPVARGARRGRSADRCRDAPAAAVPRRDDCFPASVHRHHHRAAQRRGLTRPTGGVRGGLAGLDDRVRDAPKLAVLQGGRAGLAQPPPKEPWLLMRPDGVTTVPGPAMARSKE